MMLESTGEEGHVEYIAEVKVGAWRSLFDGGPISPSRLAIKLWWRCCRYLIWIVLINKRRYRPDCGQLKLNSQEPRLRHSQNRSSGLVMVLQYAVVITILIELLTVQLRRLYPRILTGEILDGAEDI